MGKSGCCCTFKDEPPFLLISWLPLHLPQKTSYECWIYGLEDVYKTSLVEERRISGSQSSITRTLKSNKCTQQPSPFFLIRTLNGYYKSYAPTSPPLETISSPRGSGRAPAPLLFSLFSSLLAQFLLWKEGNFWQSTHNKRKEKSSQTNCRLGEHRPWTLARSKPVKQTSLTTLGTRASNSRGKENNMYIHTIRPVFSSSSWTFLLRKTKNKNIYIYKFFLALFTCLLHHLIMCSSCFVRTLI